MVDEAPSLPTPPWGFGRSLRGWRLGLLLLRLRRLLRLEGAALADGRRGRVDGRDRQRGSGGHSGWGGDGWCVECGVASGMQRRPCKS